MPRPSLLSMNDIVRQDRDKKHQQFLQDTEDFPCLFNLGNCKLDTGNRKYGRNNLCEINVPKNKWKSLLEDLNNDDEVSECDEVVWKENLLTFVYAELGEYEEALKLNKQIQSQHGKNNLVSLINAVFLFFKTDNFKEAFEKLDDLKKLKSQQTFTDLKIDAICELGYAFRKLAGAKNLQLSISFLEFVLLFRPHDEQIQLMLGIVYRRCTHFHIYSADPENINRHDFALKAAKSLNKLGTTSTNAAYKAAALIELAFLKYEDDIYDEHKHNENRCRLSREEWFQIVRQKTWKQLCEEALGVCGDESSEKVLKMGGQLYRYAAKDNELLIKSEQLLKRAITIRPSNRAYHHLGLTYRKMAVHHEQRHNTNQQYIVRTQGTVGGFTTGWPYIPNGFGNNTRGMKPTNRGNYYQRFSSRQEQTPHKGDFNNNDNARGGYSSNSVHRKPKGFINSATDMKHTGRGYQQQGFTDRLDRNIHHQSFQPHTGRGYHQRQCFTDRHDNNRHQQESFQSQSRRRCHQRDFTDRYSQNIHQESFQPHTGRGYHQQQCFTDGHDDNRHQQESFQPQSGRGCHQQDFTDRHNRNIHHQNFQPYTQNMSSGDVRNFGNDGNSGFGNNIIQMKPGNHRQSFSGRQEYYTRQQGFENSARGAGCGYSRGGYHIKPKEFVSNVGLRHINRGLHHQGFTNRSAYNRHNMNFENNTEDPGGSRLKVLPEPLTNKSPPKLEKYLKYMSKVPDQFKSFSKDNPYTDKAIQHLKQAAEISYFQNKVAVYDYACILVQKEDYEKAKEICTILIKECTSSKTLTDPIYLVNAYNLYGICCAKEAETEVIEESKKRLEAESDEYLTQAVRLASCLAATVPELEMCATDLWNAFRTLQTKFKFEGQKDSRKKLFKLCEFISDYKCLEAVDYILSQDPTELEKMEVIEECLQRYLNLQAFDSALLFRDLILLLPGIKAKLSNSKVYKQLMLEVAEGKLDETYRRQVVYRPDLGWKQLFDNEFFATGNSKQYDIVIVSDIDGDFQLKEGLMYDISEYLKRILLETFGLNVIRAHEEGLPGQNYLEEQLQIIRDSQVSIFVLTEPSIDSESVVSELAGLRISESQNSPPESTPREAMAGNQPENENSVSRMYERIINASISNCLNNVGCTRMMLVVPYSLKLEDLPQAVRGLPTVVLSQNEIETLTATASDRPSEQCLNLMKKIFRSLLGNCQENTE